MGNSTAAQVNVADLEFRVETGCPSMKIVYQMVEPSSVDNQLSEGQRQDGGEEEARPPREAAESVPDVIEDERKKS